MGGGRRGGERRPGDQQQGGNVTRVQAERRHKIGL
jgi:hypothetical protein